MKQITNMSRLVNQLERTFRLLNRDLFNDTLPMPIITVIPCNRSYAHYAPWSAWQSKDEFKREVNISSAYLDRPLENIISSLVHEMTHMYNDCILNVQDTSRNGTYHNRQFAKEAEAHGLIVTRSEKYGFAHTAPADSLLEWLLSHDELREIEICRTSPVCASIGVGTHSSNSGSITIGANPNSHSRRYICPCCHTIIRATKTVNIICGDCMKTMIEG